MKKKIMKNEIGVNKFAHCSDLTALDRGDAFCPDGGCSGGVILIPARIVQDMFKQIALVLAETRKNRKGIAEIKKYFLNDCQVEVLSKDGRSLPPAKRKMVKKAISQINDKGVHPESAIKKVFDDSEKTPDGYQSLSSFRRQVFRDLGKNAD